MILISALVLASAQAQDSHCYIMKTNTLGPFALYLFLPDKVLLGRTDNLTVEVKNIGNTNAPGNVDGFSLIKSDKHLGIFNLALSDQSGKVVQASGPIPAREAATGAEKEYIEGRRTAAVGLYPGRSNIKRLYLGKEFKLEPGASYKLSVSIEVHEDKGTSLLKIDEVPFSVEK